MKKVLILGSDGYLGNPLIHRFKKKGYEVFGIDNNSRKINVFQIGSSSLTKINKHPRTLTGDILSYQFLKKIIVDFEPDTIVHLAEQPSAPFSMIDAKHATGTQNNNITGTLNVLWAIKEVNPKIHLIKLGTAGEYPDWLYDGITISEEHRIKVKYQNKDWEIPTPRYAGSWYHFSKLYDSYNIDYACKIWGLNVTDINQGVVYGHIDGTRFDYDEYFGTIVNRFIVQAVAGIPLTIYGDSGEQTRGYININNTMDAIELVTENPPKGLDIVHQLTATYKIIDIANMIKGFIPCEFQYIENPRAENNKNTFKFEAKKLKKMGLKVIPMEDEIPNLIEVVKNNKEKINKEVIYPVTKWK